MTPLIYDAPRTQRIYAGQAVGAALLTELTRLGAQRAFVLASRSVLTEDVQQGLRAELGERLVGVHTGIPAHGPQEAVLEAVLAARAAQADVLISIGGGTPIDAAKVVQAALTHGVETLADLRALALPALNGPSNLDAARVGGLRNIAVPTTLSGAEFASLAGALNTDLKQKQGYNHPDLAPVAIVFDPALGAQTPSRLWFSAAVRTLDHGVEGFLSPDSIALYRAQFLDGISLMAEGLRQAQAALARGDAAATAQARWQSFQGVWAVSPALGRVRFGASHGLGYILGARHGVPHGETSCVLLPAVMQWNAQTLGAQMSPIAQALGVAGQAPHEAVRDFIQALGLPSRLADVGVTEADFSAIAEAAVAHPVVQANPRAISRVDDVLAILRLAA
jgi:alcohol dehydrogenase class IV